MLFLFAVAIAVVAFLLARRLATGTDDPMKVLAVKSARRVLAGLGAVFVLVALAQLVRVVPAGHVGVVDLFGVVRPEPLHSGLRLVNPLARVIEMSIKTHEAKEVMEVPSKEGLTMQLEVSALFHLEPSKAPEVYRTVGTNYLEVLFEPQFRSVARGVTASYDAKALYTSEREQLATLLAAELRELLEPRGIAVEATPLRRVGLPQRLAQAIEEKLSAEQESQRMQWVLMKEQQEAERKRIEGAGIADFQRIVSQGISEQLLQLEGDRSDDGDRRVRERQGRSSSAPARTACPSSWGASRSERKAADGRLGERLGGRRGAVFAEAGPLAVGDVEERVADDDAERRLVPARHFTLEKGARDQRAAVGGELEARDPVRSYAVLDRHQRRFEAHEPVDAEHRRPRRRRQPAQRAGREIDHRQPVRPVGDVEELLVRREREPARRAERLGAENELERGRRAGTNAVHRARDGVARENRAVARDDEIVELVRLVRQGNAGHERARIEIEGGDRSALLLALGKPSAL